MTGRTGKWLRAACATATAPIALAAACAVTFRVRPDGFEPALSARGLHAVMPLLLFWTIAGLRTAFAFPVNLQAGWIFRVTGVDLIPELARLSAEKGYRIYLLGATEVSSSAAIVELGKRNGFTYVALDLEGFRSGAMNETLTQLRRR